MSDKEIQVLGKLIAAGDAMTSLLPCFCGELQTYEVCLHCQKKNAWQLAVTNARQAREEG